MKREMISRATLSRLPVYLEYIRAQSDDRISASEMARVLKLGEVLVRKDLNSVCDKGRPKTGFPRRELLEKLEEILGIYQQVPVVVVGAGKLGTALMRYRGFREFGLCIVAGFDANPQKLDPNREECPVLPIEELESFCRSNGVHVGVITVPASAAKSVCDQMIASGITAIWNFAPCQLPVPEGIAVQNENLALSLAYLCLDKGAEAEEGENRE